MILNYLKTAYRFLIKNISFTIINIIGLTTGITAFLLIALYVQNELGYDRHIEHSDRVYRLVGIQEPRGIDKQHVAFTSGAWAGFIRENIPGVEDAFRIMSGAPPLVDVEGQLFREIRICYADGNVLEHFGIPLINGTKDDNIRLDNPNMALVSKDVALRFYDTTNVIGKTFRNRDKLYTIAGVFDNENIKTHWNANIFLSLSTIEPEMEYLQSFGSNSVSTYLFLNNDTDIQQVESIINNHYQSLREQEMYSNSMNITFYLQNIEDIYLRSGHLKFQLIHNQGNINNIYTFTLVAVLILVIACINFINLATANSAKRNREVGMRKVLGAGRKKLALQFIGESMLITFCSLLLSLVLLELLLTQFNTLLNLQLKIDFISNPLFNVGLFAILLMVGLVSGFYPALYLSRYQAAEVLKSQSASGKPQGAWLRKTLVIIQFVISAAMIMATLVVFNQVNYMKNKDRGYSHESVLAIPVGHGSTFEQIESFKNHLHSFPEVKSIGMASNYNGVAGNQSDIVVADEENTRLMVRYGFVNPDFFPTMEIEVVKGRNFSHEFGTDVYQAIIINESTANALGWDNPIGKRFMNPHNPDHDYYTVIGVIKDYHYYSLHNPIEPAVYIYMPNQLHMLNIRYSTADPQGLVANLEREFKEFFPNQYFTSYFIDEVLSRQIRTEENITKIFVSFSLLCIIISCLGLFGLTSFMINQRRKEISLRKVLGSSALQINRMLVSGFMRLVVIASLIALPVTYYIINNWLNNYPYRINISFEHFIIPFATIVIIAVTTIMVLSTRAALQNPAENLKYE